MALVVLPMLSSTASVSAAGELKVIRTANVGDVVVTLFGATGAWTMGDNTFVLEFDSGPRKRLIHVGAATLTATSPSASGPPLRVLARLERGDVEGRYVGRITLPRAGESSVIVAWSRARSQESATFPVLVQAALNGAR